MGLQGVEAPGPQAPVGLEPGVDLAQRLGSQVIQAALTVHPHSDQACFSQDSQVLGDPGLAQAYTIDQFADRSLALPEEIENLPPRGLGQNRECHLLYYASLVI
jgi:hypothetical protein